MTKINSIKKRWYNLLIFQKTDKNRLLNIHSICNYSDHFFSVSYSYIFISFISDLDPPDIFVSYDASMV